MARLSLYVDARGRSALHRDGFTWLGGFLLPVWALTRRMWLTSFAAAILGTVINQVVVDSIGRLGETTLATVLSIGWPILWIGACGALANRWHRIWLQRAGYRLIATELSRPSAIEPPRSDPAR